MYSVVSTDQTTGGLIKETGKMFEEKLLLFEITLNPKEILSRDGVSRIHVNSEELETLANTISREETHCQVNKEENPEPLMTNKTVEEIFEERGE